MAAGDVLPLYALPHHVLVKLLTCNIVPTYIICLHEVSIYVHYLDTKNTLYLKKKL